MEIKSFEDLAAAFGTHHDEVKVALKTLTEKASETSARLSEVEQKGARRGPREDGGDVTLGSRFISSEAVKAFDPNSRSSRVGFETKATVTTTTGNAAGDAGAAIEPFRDPNIVPLRQRRPVVRELLPVIQMTGGSVDVVKIAGRNNNAAPVAEGAVKPQSDMRFGLENIPARVVAHWIKASRQVMEDLPQLKGLIDTELLDGLALVEEGEILNGDGTSQHLDGLIPNATAFAAPFAVTAPTMLDTIGLGLLQSALAEQPADGIIMHPSDWTRITLLKDGDGNYIMGPPGSPIAQRLWGIPVVTTQAMTIDKFLIGNYRNAATLYDRWLARIEVGHDGDDFTRNLVTILGEERLALAVKEPKALTYGDFGNVT